MKDIQINISGRPGTGVNAAAHYIADTLSVHGFSTEVVTEHSYHDEQGKRLCGEQIKTSRQISAMGHNGARVLITANQEHREGSLQSLEFEVGNRYRTQGGKWVKLVERKDDLKGYECILGDDGKWRYNRLNDRGRCTGSPHDFSCEDNLIPLYAHSVPGEIESMRIDLKFALRDVENLKRQLAAVKEAVSS